MDRRFGGTATLLCAGLALALCAACSGEAPYEPAPQSVEAAPMDADEAAPAPAAADEAPHHDDDHHDDAHQDHDEHDAHAAGGEAHVHGAAELAVTQESNFVTVTVDAPLANYGLSEKTKKKATDLEKYADGLTELMGNARCDLVERSADLRRSGDHAALTLSIVWDCRRPSQLDGLMFTGFDTYSGFETVEAVFLGEAGETASATLTADNPFLPFGS